MKTKKPEFKYVVTGKTIPTGETTVAGIGYIVPQKTIDLREGKGNQVSEGFCHIFSSCKSKAIDKVREGRGDFYPTFPDHLIVGKEVNNNSG